MIDVGNASQSETYAFHLLSPARYDQVHWGVILSKAEVITSNPAVHHSQPTDGRKVWSGGGLDNTWWTRDELHS